MQALYDYLVITLLMLFSLLSFVALINLVGDTVWQFRERREKRDKK